MKLPDFNKIKLTDPAHIERHKEFVKMCVTIKVRQKDIVKWTKESKGNVSAFYNGKVPIGDSFYGKFWNAFGTRLKSNGFSPDDLSFANEQPVQTHTKTDLADMDKEMARLRTENILLRKENQALRDIIIEKFSEEELERLQIIVSRPKGN